MSPLIALVLGANKRAKLSPSELELGALNSKITFGSGASFYGTCGGVGSTVKFFTPTTVANHGPDKDLTLRARLGNVAHDCEAFGTLARPCVATADPDHPPLFYGELSSNGSATSRLGPFKANASSRMDATGLSTITFTYLDVPVPWSTFIGVTSHQYGPIATYPLELTIIQVVCTLLGQRHICSQCTDAPVLGALRRRHDSRPCRCRALSSPSHLTPASPTFA